MNGLALCAGGGGLELGLHIARPGYRTVCYVEREAYAASSLVARMEAAELDQAPIWDDLRTFDGSAWRGVVDIVSAGYPCQPFSTAGRRRGADDPRHLWPEVARIVDECGPEFVFLENVANHLRLGFREVHDQLGAMGFAVAAGLFSAAEVGAGHERKRLFVLAHRQGGGRPGQQLPAGPGPEGDGAPHPAGGGAAVADTQGHVGRGEQPAGQSERGWTGPARGGAVLADAQGVRWGQTERGEPARAQSDAAGGSLAHPGGAGFPFAEQPGKSGSEERRHLSGPAAPEFRGAPLLFAPGPGDGRWGAIVTDHPDLAPSFEPAVRGMAHGMAYRVDRLRLCGNGVSSLAGAFAFRTLHAALFPHGESVGCDSAVRR